MMAHQGSYLHVLWWYLLMGKILHSIKFETWTNCDKKLEQVIVICQDTLSWVHLKHLWNWLKCGETICKILFDLANDKTVISVLTPICTCSFGVKISPLTFDYDRNTIKCCII